MNDVVRSPRDPARAESVGSLIRPPRVKALLEEIYGAHSTASALVLSEQERERLGELDRAVDALLEDLVARQVASGLDVVTDGELRRAMFTASVTDALGGTAEKARDIQFKDEHGADDASVPSDPHFVSHVEKVASPAVREIRALRSVTDHPFKITLPAASFWFYPSSRFDEAVYPSRDELVEDVVGVTRELIEEAIEAGARHIQLDFPVYPLLADEGKRDAMLSELGESADSLLSKGIDADNRVIEGLPEDVVTAMHICRGNYRSRWWLEGSLEPVAEALFGQLHYDRFLVEWDDVGREGDYTPLRFVPPGPIVVMGLISSKNAEIEQEDEVLRRLDTAARSLNIEQLALSPQCGFASTWHGNDVTEDQQWKKLELVGRVADRVWNLRP